MKEKDTLLHFPQDRPLRVLMISDIQETLHHDGRALRGMHAIMEAEKPDLVILGGDNVDGRKVKTQAELSQYLDIFTRPMEDRNIPWIHIYGNHDHDADVPALEQSALYRAYPHCISGISPDGVPGATNYMIPICYPDSDTTAFCIYAFDSLHKDSVYPNGATTADLLLPNKPYHQCKWDFVRFEQLMWYWNTSKEMESSAGHKIPGMAVMHILPSEASMMLANPEETGMTGEYEEVMQCSALNSGMFATFLQRGDISVIAAGHSHKDTIDGVYGGIRMCMDACVGFAPPGIDELRGGRIFEITPDGHVESHMIFLKDYIDITL